MSVETDGRVGDKENCVGGNGDEENGDAVKGKEPKGEGGEDITAERDGECLRGWYCWDMLLPTSLHGPPYIQLLRGAHLTKWAWVCLCPGPFPSNHKKEDQRCVRNITSVAGRWIIPKLA